MTKRILVDNNNFSAIMGRLSQHRRLIVDTETNGLNPWLGHRICGVSVAVPTLNFSAYFPFRHETGGNLPHSTLRKLIHLISKADIITYFNAKFDIEILMMDGMPIPSYDHVEDVMLSAHLLNENEPSFKLKELAQKYIDPQARTAELELMHQLADLGLGKGDMWRLHPKHVVRYACDDVIFTEKLRRLHIPGLRNWSLSDIWSEVNNYVLSMVRAEQRGMLINVPLTEQYIEEANKKIAPCKRLVQRMAGYALNMNSSPQIQEFLGVSSSAKEILEPMAERGDRRAKAVLEYRGWAKVNGTYYYPFLELLDENNVLHPNILLHGTVSGRPSAKKPPLQAIPRYTKVYKVKDIFIARPKHILISADYSQMELRLGAHYARDRFLLRAFRKGVNIHKMTAKALGVDYDKGKRINFATLYGVGRRKLAKELGITEGEAATYLKAAHRRHPNYYPLYSQLEEHAQHFGYIRLWSGRVRRYNTPQTYNEVHKALSNFIQGGVAEIMRYSITAIDKELVQAGLGHVLMQVHDQIIMETPAELLPQVIPQMVEIMCGFPEFSVPFVVDISTGSPWGKLKKRKET